MQPPCLTPGSAINPCARRLYEEKVLGHLDLAAEWSGWRLRGRWLISPEGDRISPERLRGLLFSENGSKRVSRATFSPGHTATVVPLFGRPRSLSCVTALDGD